MTTTMTTTDGLTLDEVRELALALPSVEEGTTSGTPVFRVRGRFLARMREDGQSLVLRMGRSEREVLTRARPAAYFFTEYHAESPLVVVRLAAVDREELAEHLAEAWRRVAPSSLVAKHEAAVH
jgi:hypothetical protein